MSLIFPLVLYFRDCPPLDSLIHPLPTLRKSEIDPFSQRKRDSKAHLIGFGNIKLTEAAMSQFKGRKTEMFSMNLMDIGNHRSWKVPPLWMQKGSQSHIEQQNSQCQTSFFYLKVIGLNIKQIIYIRYILTSNIDQIYVSNNNLHRQIF